MVYSDHIPRWPNNTHVTRCSFLLPHSMFYHSKISITWLLQLLLIGDPSSLGNHILDFLISMSTVVSENPTITLIIVFMVIGTHVFFSFLLTSPRILDWTTSVLVLVPQFPVLLLINRFQLSEMVWTLFSVGKSFQRIYPYLLPEITLSFFPSLPHDKHNPQHVVEVQKIYLI